MLKLDKNKLAGLKTFDDHLQEDMVTKTVPSVRSLKQRLKLGTMQNFLRMNASAKM